MIHWKSYDNVNIMFNMSDALERFLFYAKYYVINTYYLLTRQQIKLFYGCSDESFNTYIPNISTKQEIMNHPILYTICINKLLKSILKKNKKINMIDIYNVFIRFTNTYSKNKRLCICNILLSNIDEHDLYVYGDISYYFTDIEDNEIIELFVNKFKKLICYVRDKTNNNILHTLSCRKTKTSVIKLILEQNIINVNDKNNYGKSALYYSSYYNNYETTKILLNHGCNPE